MATYQTLGMNNFDLQIEAGTFVFKTDAEAIAEQLRLRLNLVKNNWFLNLNEGLDYFGSIFGKKRIDTALVSEFKMAILETVGVTELTAFTAEFAENRNLEISFTVNTIFSEPISDTVNINV